MIGHRAANPNAADVVFLMPGANGPEPGEDWTLCCLILDSADAEEVKAARARWKLWKESGHALTYWQQEENGKWVQKGEG